MSEHRAVAVIPGEPDDVFAYLSDLRKLSAYLPMVTSARRTGREDAVVRIQVGGVPSTHGVWLRAYRDRRQLAWGTTDNIYRGEVHVSPPREPEADPPPAGSTEYEACPISLVTFTLESDHHSDGEFQQALDDAASALSLAIRRAAAGR